MPNDTNTAAAASTEPKKLNNLQDVDGAYFPPSKIAKEGVAYITAISAIANLPADAILCNGTWATDGEFPPSHGLLVLPIGKQVPVMKEITQPDGSKKSVATDENKRITERVVCAAVPTLEALQATDPGLEFILEAVHAKYATKLRNSLVRAEDVTKVPLPFTIAEFIEKSERGAADQGLRSYKDLAPRMVQSLGKKGIVVNVQLLREILQSSKFSEALMPKVSQNVWTKVLDTFKAIAIKENKPTAIFEHWLATRDQAQVETAMDDIDFDVAA